jgi:hypothetical protein
LVVVGIESGRNCVRGMGDRMYYYNVICQREFVHRILRMTDTIKF